MKFLFSFYMSHPGDSYSRLKYKRTHRYVYMLGWKPKKSFENCKFYACNGAHRLLFCHEKTVVSFSAPKPIICHRNSHRQHIVFLLPTQMDHKSNLIIDTFCYLFSLSLLASLAIPRTNQMTGKNTETLSSGA